MQRFIYGHPTAYLPLDNGVCYSVIPLICRSDLIDILGPSGERL
ncbi:MAG: hypothetical protein U0892_01120 [Pirellulales bacterium]